MTRGVLNLASSKHFDSGCEMTFRAFRAQVPSKQQSRRAKIALQRQMKPPTWREKPLDECSRWQVRKRFRFMRQIHKQSVPETHLDHLCCLDLRGGIDVTRRYQRILSFGCTFW